MTIHVSEKQQDYTTVLKVDGRLKADDVAELTRACQSAQGMKALDLSELQSADSAGLAMLRKRISTGAQIPHASPTTELLLKTKS